MNKFIPALFLLIITLLPALHAESKELSGEENYKLAMDLLEKEDLTRALPYLTKAVEAGHPDAMVQMVYVLPDMEPEMKRSLLRKAAEKGNAFAQFNLGNYYYRKEPAKAAEYYKQAMLSGHPKAGTMYGLCCLQGLGVEKDKTAARKAFETDIARNDPVAMNYCAVMLCSQGKFEAGIALLEKAASHNYPPAVNNLGILARNGNTLEDRKKAFRFFNRAANLGYLPGLRNLAMAYVTGCGTTINYKTARRFAMSAVKQGDVPSMFILGMMDLYGYGSDADPVSAFNWYLQAAENGHVPAMQQVAEMYRTGTGVKADPDAAAKWLQRAKIATPPEEPETLPMKDEEDNGK